MSAEPQAGAAPRQIFAMGGGGFTMEPANPLLDDFVLGLATAKRTAHPLPADGERRHHRTDHRLQGPLCGQVCACRVPLPVQTQRSRRPLRDIILEQDIIYVSGGSMRNLLALWHAHGLDRLLIEAWRAGTVLAGLSAGRHVLVHRRRHPLERSAGTDRRPRPARRFADRPCRRRARAPARVARERCATERSRADGRSTTASGCCSAVSDLERVVSSRTRRRRPARRCDRRRARAPPPRAGDARRRPLGALGGSTMLSEDSALHQMRRGMDRRARLRRTGALPPPVS